MQFVLVFALILRSSPKFQIVHSHYVYLSRVNNKVNSWGNELKDVCCVSFPLITHARFGSFIHSIAFFS